MKLLPLLVLLAVGCGATRYARVEYLNVRDRDGELAEYVQTTTGVRYEVVEDHVQIDVGGGLHRDLVWGEEEYGVPVLSLGGAAYAGKVTLFASFDVIEPWKRRRELTGYVSLEVQY